MVAQLTRFSDGFVAGLDEDLVDGDVIRLLESVYDRGGDVFRVEEARVRR